MADTRNNLTLIITELKHVSFETLSFVSGRLLTYMEGVSRVSASYHSVNAIVLHLFLNYLPHVDHLLPNRKGEGFLWDKCIFLNCRLCWVTGQSNKPGEKRCLPSSDIHELSDAHDWLWSLWVTGERERVCHLSHPESTRFCCCASASTFSDTSQIFQILRIGEPARSSKLKWNINEICFHLGTSISNSRLLSDYDLFEYPI